MIKNLEELLVDIKHSIGGADRVSIALNLSTLQPSLVQSETMQCRCRWKRPFYFKKQLKIKTDMLVVFKICKWIEFSLKFKYTREGNYSQPAAILKSFLHRMYPCMLVEF